MLCYSTTFMCFFQWKSWLRNVSVFWHVLILAGLIMLTMHSLLLVQSPQNDSGISIIVNDAYFVREPSNTSVTEATTTCFLCLVLLFSELLSLGYRVENILLMSMSSVETWCDDATKNHNYETEVVFEMCFRILWY